MLFDESWKFNVSKLLVLITVQNITRKSSVERASKYPIVCNTNKATNNDVDFTRTHVHSVYFLAKCRLHFDIHVNLKLYVNRVSN